MPAPMITALALLGMSLMVLIHALCGSAGQIAPTPPPGLGQAGPAESCRLMHAAYSTGISLLIRPRSIPCLLRTMRATTKMTMASTYIAPM